MYLRPMHLRPLLLAVLLAAAGCTPAKEDGISAQGQAFDGIAPDEVVTLTGTEPSWNITIERGKASYADPDHPEARSFAVSRFAGNNGLGFSGDWDGVPVTISITPGQCSDGMSDRTFPYVATIALGEETMRGCGYTDRQPFTGPEAP